MNKAQLVENMVERTGETKATVERCIKAYHESCVEGLQNDGELKLVGFGTYSVKRTKARKGRNPQTGEDIEIPAQNRIAFKASKSIVDKVQ